MFVLQLYLCYYVCVTIMFVLFLFYNYVHIRLCLYDFAFVDLILFLRCLPLCFCYSLFTLPLSQGQLRMLYVQRVLFWEHIITLGAYYLPQKYLNH